MVSLGKHNNLAKLDIEGERLAWLGSHQIVTPVDAQGRHRRL